MLWKKKKKKTFSPRLLNRVEKLSTDQLTVWIENLYSEIGLYLRQHPRGTQEAADASEALACLMAERLKRQ